jgi:hypothetical protein
VKPHRIARACIVAWARHDYALFLGIFPRLIDALGPSDTARLLAREEPHKRPVMTLQSRMRGRGPRMAIRNLLIPVRQLPLP